METPWNKKPQKPKLTSDGFNSSTVEGNNAMSITDILKSYSDQIDITFTLEPSDKDSLGHYKVSRIGHPCMQTSGRKTTLYATLKPSMSFDNYSLDGEHRESKAERYLAKGAIWIEDIDLYRETVEKLSRQEPSITGFRDTWNYITKKNDRGYDMPTSYWHDYELFTTAPVELEEGKTLTLRFGDEIISFKDAVPYGTWVNPDEGKEKETVGSLEGPYTLKIQVPWRSSIDLETAAKLELYGEDSAQDDW